MWINYQNETFTLLLFARIATVRGNPRSSNKRRPFVTLYLIGQHYVDWLIKTFVAKTFRKWKHVSESTLK